MKIMTEKMGRPLKFKTEEELTEKIEEYFNTCPKDEWTITGLAMALDTYRCVLCDYGSGKYDEDDKDFSNTVKKAKQIVENGYEIDLKKHGRSGTIFALKNFDWKDKNETDLTSKGEKIIPIFNGQSLQKHNSDKEDIPTNEEDKSSERGDISE